MVGYEYLPYQDAVRRYPPDTLQAGWNLMDDGEEVFYIPNPALGLWAEKRKFEA